MFAFSDNDAITRLKILFDGTEVEKGLKQLKTTVESVFGAISAKMLLNYTNELAKMGMKAEAIEKGFSKFASERNRSVDSMVKTMKQATMNMIDDSELMQMSSRSMLLGLPFDKVVVGMQYASKYAIAMGLDVSQTIEELMDALSRQNLRGLKRFGIDVKGSKDIVNDAITQMQKKTNDLAVSIDDAAVKTNQMNAAIAEQKERLGKDLIPVYEATLIVMNDLAKAAGTLMKGWGDFWKFMGALSAGGVQTAVTNLLIENANKMEDKGKAIVSLETEKEMILKRESKLNKDNEKDQEKYLKLKYQESLLTDAINKLKSKDPEQQPTELNKSGGLTEEERKKAREKARKEAEEDQKKTEDAAKKGFADIRQWYEDDARVKYENQVKAHEAQLKEQKEFDDQIEEEFGGSQENLDKITQEAEIAAIDIQDKKKKQKEKEMQRYQDVLTMAAQTASGLNSLSDAIMNREIRNLDKRHMSQRAYDKAVAKIEAEADKRSRTFARMQQAIILGQTIMNVAQSVSKTNTAYPWPWSLIPAGFAAAEGGIQIETIQAQHFQTGRLGSLQRGRSADSINALLGPGETVIPAPQTAMHQEALQAIMNNTANTASGVRKLNGGTSVYNFYGVSTEQILTVQKNSQRRNRTAVAL
jgi:hypothetical protein